MNPQLKELIEALPQENEAAVKTESVEIPEQGLREIFASLSHREIPIGSLHRFWTLGDLSAQLLGVLDCQALVIQGHNTLRVFETLCQLFNYEWFFGFLHSFIKVISDKQKAKRNAHQGCAK